MRIPLYQLDAFAGKAFGGNPAAVCPLEAWLDDAAMQAIAAENNLAETAFFVPVESGRYHIRWFTPAKEADLCGHATLASAKVVFEKLAPAATRITFDSRSGPLHVSVRDGRLELDFPSLPATPCEAPGLARALGAAPAETLCANGLLAVFPTEAAVRALIPDMERIKEVHPHAVMVTAPGDDVDFVSRFFAPNAGIPEDPATGSAHCTLAPYWAARLGTPVLRARQVSARTGEFWCELAGDRVRIAGHVFPYLEGTIEV